MQIEEYFDVHSPFDIRLRGTRVGIETVLLAYLDNKQSPEQIATQFPNLTLELIYATILFYLSNRERVDCYLESFLNDSRRRQAEQDANPPDAILAIRQRRSEIANTASDERSANNERTP